MISTISSQVSGLFLGMSKVPVQQIHTLYFIKSEIPSIIECTITIWLKRKIIPNLTVIYYFLLLILSYSYQKAVLSNWFRQTFLSESILVHMLNQTHDKQCQPWHSCHQANSKYKIYNSLKILTWGSTENDPTYLNRRGRDGESLSASQN